MNCQPRLLLDRPATPKVSVILLDWGVRESFHSLHYLNRQTVPRPEYELIWIEFYGHQPAPLRDLAARHRALDRWIVLGHPPETIYHKHRMYNIGLVAARGEVCVICDSDAIFRPTFLQSILDAARRRPDTPIHIDQVRNDSPRFYPFNYPDVDEVARDVGTNWRGHATAGVLIEDDRVHRANMGACLAARRDDMLAVGGADEHIDYLGYLCGPYDLTFRLCNRRQAPEHWLRDEYIYHTWHPNTSGVNADHHGPGDGRMMALRALHARATGRVLPYTRSPLLPVGPAPTLADALAAVSGPPEPAWHRDAAPRDLPDGAYLVAADVAGYSLSCHKGAWYGIPVADGPFDPARAAAGGYPLMVTGETELDVQDKAMRRPYPGLGPLARLTRHLRREPLHRLPLRVLRKAGRLLGGLFGARV